ncbi:stalk domain-containing protein [Cohnella faecalis]|uniref:Copper amine oxidase N-terminal domain-containing protein n=1 Tax=Cohnella faecalis TaxID=2315694 RepID=A0A398CK03_9BACL|nr:copper amine oxidase N-terminal domain-containing protein [Cohnella faecalis]RIE01519.1 copper amine oxidase N-terminal domain-containing protein [Cohnella faecalis]
MRKLLAPLMAVILLLTFAVPTLAAQPIKLTVNGKAVTGVNVKTQKGTLYIPFKDTSKLFGVTSTFHKESNSVIVGKGIEQAKKMKRTSAARLIVNGKVITGVTNPTISSSTHIPLLKVAQALGVKASWNDKTKTVTITTASLTTKSIPEIENLQNALKSFSADLNLNSESVSALTKYQKEFFAKDRSPLSLKKVAKTVSAKDIAKKVSSYYSAIVRLSPVELDSVQEFKLSNGQVVTGAIGHTGGTYSQITESWKDSTYFVIFYLGSNDLKKGDKATVNGIPVGKTQIELTNALGATWQEPLYAVAAGNFLSVSEEYDIEKEQSQGGSIDWSALDKKTQERINKLLLVTLSDEGLLINDRTYTYGLEITKVQINDYEYVPTSKTELPDGSLTIPISSFKDSKGNPLTAQSGSFFVMITTNKGEFFKYVDFE